jgi:poly(3-hydroxybutyrate) depolymerase
MDHGSRQFPSMAFLWPALAAEATSELAAATARELVKLAVGSDTEEAARCEPQWTTRNKVALELPAVRLRDFSTAPDGPVTLICAPFALHGATIVDFAPGHSLVAALQSAGIGRMLVTDWRSATPEMRFWSIDDYLAALNVLVDEFGVGAVDLIGLCQGGWMALTYAARFPAKVRKLVLAGAPIDLGVGCSRLSELTSNTPSAFFAELVELGGGRALGQHLLQFWAPEIEREEIHRLLQPSDAMESWQFRSLEARFRDWYAWTVDLPGAYYLQVVEQLFKENRLAAGEFVALGHSLDLSRLGCPLFLLAASDDEVVAPEQLFAAERLIGRGRRTAGKALAPCGHLGLFMGRNVLSTAWSDIARWLQQPI